MLSAAPTEDLSRLLQIFASRLGNIETYDTPHGEANMALNNFHKLITAQYVFPVKFERAEGQVTLRLIQENGQWKLLALHVNPPALLQ
jgi:hypothetical protein